MGRLRREFFSRPAEIVARDLIGKVLARGGDGTELRGRVVEVEAYRGRSDPGSHAYRGRTLRNAVMFGPAGHLYVYFTYGMHYCANVVTDTEGEAGAVLVRALEPLGGLELMQERRGRRRLHELCSGPAKLCQAFGIAREQNGIDLVSSDIWIEEDGFEPASIETSRRIGLSAGADAMLRFYVLGNKFVSRQGA
jgi:DNA-3-methyladenine glycosylase